MKVIFKSMSRGKTHDIVKYAVQNNHTIVVTSNMQKEEIIKTYKIDPKKIIVFDSMKSIRLRGNCETFCLDNAHLFLQRFFEGRLRAITLNDEADIER